MADDVTFQPTVATPPTGTKVATDDVGGSHYQKVKLDLGADGLADPAVGTVPVSGSVTADIGAGPFPVSGTVSVTEPVSVDDNGGSLTIDAAALPLPTGAATAALQLPDGHNVVVTGTVSVVEPVTVDGTVAVTGVSTAALQLPDGHNVTVDNGAGAAAVPIQDGGNAITVDGTVGVSAVGGTVAVTQSGAWDEVGIHDSGNSITVDGTVTANLAAGTNNIGDVDVLSSALPTGAATAALQLPNSHDVTVDNAAGAAAVNVQDGGNSLTVDGTVAVSAVSGNVSVIPQTKNTYFYLIPSQVHVAGANTVHLDVFNADAALIVRIVSILQIPNVTTAVTGIVFDWLLERTTSAGTGGSAITAWLPDLSQTALDADVTCRSKPTGGAAASTDLRSYSLSSEETNAATIMVASLGGLELVPEPLRFWRGGIMLRQNQGVRVVQVTNSNAGNTGWLIGFTVE